MTIPEPTAPTFAALWHRMRSQGLEAIAINPVDHPDAWAKWLHWYVLNGNDEPMRMMQKHQRKLVPCLDPFDPDERFMPEWTHRSSEAKATGNGEMVRNADASAARPSDRAADAVERGRGNARRRLLYD